MKKVIILGLIAIVAGIFISEAYQSKLIDESKSLKTDAISEQTKQANAWELHQYQDLECKTCHTCDYPTKLDPCLIACPRTGMATVHHSPDEGPEVILMNQNAERYGVVVFSHLLHAEMFEMGEGCVGCHHYNLTGPIQKCESCHSSSRLRTDISKPDLRASFHRQCMDCHRQWDNNTTCTSCHKLKANDSDEKIRLEMERVLGRKHPKIEEPEQIIYETNYNKGKLVTFYHDEHIQLYSLECASCHKNDGCISCHNKNPLLPRERIKRDLTFKEQHNNCISCHEDNSCNKCHSQSVAARFEHNRSTGFELKWYHEQLTCNKCHTTNNFAQKISSNCLSCHSNWEQGKFDHRKTGFQLDELHNEFDCESCHIGNKYIKKPECNDCHGEEYVFPKNLPGKYIKR